MANAPPSPSHSKPQRGNQLEVAGQGFTSAALSGFYYVATSGLAVAVGTAATHPLDVLKVRLQMQLIGQRGPLIGLGKLFTELVKCEGLGSLYLGLAPALTRAVTYGGLRLGLYKPSKYACEMTLGSTNVFVKLASGAFCGAVATLVANPTEVVKVRLQMNTSPKGGTLSEVRNIVHVEGIRALWKGVGPAMARAATLTATQLASYDESKQALMKWTPLKEGLRLHFISSAFAGSVSTLVTAPMDMVKTRLMLQLESVDGKTYKNAFHCAYKVVRAEGPLALYKGGFSTFARLGPQTTITLIVCEKLRKIAGMEAM